MRFIVHDGARTARLRFDRGAIIPTAGARGIAVAGNFIYVADSAGLLILYHATQLHFEPIGMDQNIFRARAFGPVGATAQFPIQFQPDGLV